MKRTFRCGQAGRDADSFDAMRYEMGVELSERLRPAAQVGIRPAVGAAGMAIDAEFDRATGCVKLPGGVTVRVGFVLNDDSATSLRIVAQDPNTDADLYRSPSEIPVKLGM